MEEKVLATERYGSLERWRYRLKDGELEREREGEDRRWTRSSVVGVLKSVFLPQGYPESVSDDYLQYQFWDTVQAFSSSLSGTLSTQASLRGVGVGNQEATVAAATITWLLRANRSLVPTRVRRTMLLTFDNFVVFAELIAAVLVVNRDYVKTVERMQKAICISFYMASLLYGTGMLGRILFAWVKGSKLDCDAKKWRLVADVLNDIAMFMEIVAPNFPSCFTFIICIAGIFKSIVGVAGGATRAALTMHQARRDNMADVSAKDGSQETLVNLAGLLVSLVLIPLVTDNTLWTFTLFFFFTILHLLANYRAVRSVVMETLNEARLSILLHQYLQDGRIPCPAEANQREPVFLEFRRKVPIKLGVRLGEVVTNPEELQLALKYNNNPYLIAVKHGSVCVCLGEDVSTREEIKAMCQAVCLSSVLLSPLPSAGALKSLSAACTHGLWELVSESHKLIEQIFPPFLKGLEDSGWQVDRTLLDWDEWRVDWRKKSD